MIKEEYSKEEIRSAIISLSIVNDMPIPQRLLEVKKFLVNDITDDDVKKINEQISLIRNGNEPFIDLSVYNDFKKMEGNKPKFRQYHFFKDFYQQIAIATILHNKDFLLSLKKFYKELNSFFRKDLLLEKKKTNYGNISWTGKEPICDESISKSLFRPFYMDWKSKWNDFLKRINSLKYDNALVIKLDFIDSYNNLDPKIINSKESIFGNFDNETLKPIKLLKEINNFYKYYDYDKKIKKSGIPYGGPVESHMIANALIIEKLHRITKELIYKYKLEVVDVISYADDSCIVIKNNEDAQKKVKQFFDESKLVKELMFYKPSIEDKTKTYIFNVENGNYNELRESYTSLSTLNAIYLAQEMSEVNLDIQSNEKRDSVNKFAERKKRLDSKKYINELLRPSSIKWHKVLHNNKLDRFTYYYIYLLLKKFTNVRDRNLILTNFIKVLIPEITIDDSMDENKTKLLNGVVKILVKTLYLSIENNDSILPSLLANFIKNEIQQILSNRDYSIKNVNWKDYLKDEDHLLGSLISPYLGCVTNQKYENNNENFIFDNKRLLEFISKNKKSIDSHQRLSQFIISISKINGCDYTFLDIPTSIKIIFSDEEHSFSDVKESENKSSNKFYLDLGKYKNEEYQYWSLIKKVLSFIFSKMFENNTTLLYYRFSRMLNSSENRIEFITNCEHLADSLNRLPDINERRVTDVDLQKFKLINLTPDIYAPDDEWLINTDKLIVIRQFVASIWENGSLSTQSYTFHNHIHGDTLLLRYHQMRFNSDIRNTIPTSSINIYPLIASFYLHDIGMLLNAQNDEFFSGEIKSIYEKIANSVRVKHGKKSSEIIFTRLSKLLRIKNDWVLPIMIASTAHQEGIDNLPSLDKKDRINAMLLSICDLFDITFERASMLSRIVTGGISSDISKKHWLKHYIVRNVSFKFVLNKESENVDIWELNKGTKNANNWEIKLEITLNKNIVEQYILESVKESGEEKFSKYKNLFIEMPNHNDNSLIKMWNQKHNSLRQMIEEEFKKYLKISFKTLWDEISESGEETNYKLVFEYLFKKFPEKHNVVFYNDIKETNYELFKGLKKK